MLKINNENIIKVYKGVVSISNIFVNSYSLLTIETALVKYNNWQVRTSIDDILEVVNQGTRKELNDLVLYSSLGILETNPDAIDNAFIGNGSRYGDTQFNPPNDENWTINLLQEITGSSGFFLNGCADNSIYLGQSGTSQQIARFNGVSTGGPTREPGYHLTTLSYSKDTQKADVYFNGEKFGYQVGGATFNGSTHPFILGKLDNSFNITSKIGSFEVSNKYYTQEDADTSWRSAQTTIFTEKGIEGFDVFLLIGQSNMVGYGTPIDPILDTPNDRIYNYGYTRRDFKVASNPLDHWDEPADSIGMGMTFAKQYIQTNNPNRAVLLVTAASGGTSFSAGEWTPDGSRYLAAIETVNEAMNYHPDTSLKGILWHQGESDYALTQNEYSSYLDTMIADLRVDVNGASSSTPFVCGNFIWSLGQGVKDALADTPNRVNDSYFVDLSDLTDKGDGIHFDTPSLRTMGERYFNALP